MAEIRNGMSTREFGYAGWRKSSYSGAVGNCVELAWVNDRQIAVRNSRDPHGPVLVHSPAALTRLLSTAQNW